MFKYKVGALIACLFLSACGTTTTIPQTNSGSLLSQKLTIVTTFFPYYVFAKNLVGDKAEVISLIDNAVGPHEYQLKPSDVRSLSTANLVIKNGLGLDDWVDEAIASSGSKAEVFTASLNLDVLATTEPVLLEEEADEHADHEGPNDPHVWVSPKNVLKIITALETKIITLDPTNSVYYETQFAEYFSKITQLDKEIAGKLSGLQHQPFVSFHDAFQYFIRDYGLVQTVPIEAFPGKEPTPKYIEKLINFIKTTHTQAIFSEPQFSPHIVQSLAEQLHLSVESLDPLETGQYTASAYEDITRENVRKIAKALAL